MKSSEVYSTSHRPVGSLATRAATVVLVVSAFLLGALWGGMGQTAWAQAQTNEPTSTATVTATIEPTATPTLSLLELTPTPTIPAGRNLTPVIGTQTPGPTPLVNNLPAFNCGDGATVKQVIWEKNTWTVTLDCPNLKFKAAGAVD